MRLIAVIILLAGLFISACSDGLTGEDFIAHSAVIYIRSYDSEHVSVSGVVSATEFPEIEYVKLNDTCTTDTECFSNVDNGKQISISGIPVTSDNFTVVIKTNNGKLTGSISTPEPVTDYSISHTDTLHKDETLVLEWNDCHCDFYHVMIHYVVPRDGHNFSELIDTVMTDTIWELPGAAFPDSGFFRVISIDPTNGPLNRAGVPSNLHGDGYGYLTWALTNKSFWFDKVYVVK